MRLSEKHMARARAYEDEAARETDPLRRQELLLRAHARTQLAWAQREREKRAFAPRRDAAA